MLPNVMKTERNVFCKFCRVIILAIVIAAQPSTSITVASITMSLTQTFWRIGSRSSLRNHDSSFAHEDSATYSASPEDKATTVRIFDFQNMGALLTVIINSEVERLVEVRPP